MAESSSATAEGPFASIICMGASDESRVSVEAVLSGDTDAFETIVSEYKGLVFHVMRSMITDSSEHEDLAQDIFIRVFESLRGFGFRCSLATWISRIAYNTCLNRLRRSRSHPQDNPENRTELEWTEEVEQIWGAGLTSPNALSPQAVMCRREMEVAVREAIGKLPLTYRLVVTLYYLEGFGLPELAESIGMPLGTIKSHLFRARAILKDYLLQKFTIEDLLQ